MKLTFSKNKETSKINGSTFFRKLCGDSPYLIINTQCGVGKYKFNKIGYDNNNKMVIEYMIVNDNKYSDTNNILHTLGKFYYLSATQLLYAFKFYANS